MVTQLGKDLKTLKSSVDAGMRLQDDLDHLLNYVTNVIVPNLEKMLRDIRAQIEEPHKLDEVEVGQPNAVIHYTSLASLVSMLQKAEKRGSSSLRLYDSNHFNDPDEGNFFDRTIKLPRKLKTELLDTNYSPHAYIASFIIPHIKPRTRDARSKRDMSDNLVFWRVYGDEGMGCSLKLVVPRDRLRRVLYGPDAVKQTRQILVPFLESILNCLSPLLKLSLAIDIRQHLIRAVAGHMDNIRYLYKSEAYDYERECRLVVPEVDTDENLIVFQHEERDGYGMRIRHYYEVDELEVMNTFVTGSLITLGPRVPKPDNVRYYLENLLQKAGRPYGTKFRTSRIAYQVS